LHNFLAAVVNSPCSGKNASGSVVVQGAMVGASAIALASFSHFAKSIELSNMREGYGAIFRVSNRQFFEHVFAQINTGQNYPFLSESTFAFIRLYSSLGGGQNPLERILRPLRGKSDLAKTVTKRAVRTNVHRSSGEVPPQIPCLWLVSKA